MKLPKLVAYWIPFDVAAESFAFLSSKRVWMAAFSRLFSGSFASMVLFFAGASFHLFCRWQYSNQTLHLGLCLVLIIVLIIQRLRFVLALVLGFYLAAISFNLHLNAEFPRQWERKNIQIEADIIGLPRISKSDVRFYANVRNQFTDSDLNTLIGERVLLSCYRCDLTIKHGQRWRFTVRVKRPHGYASPNAFDYEKYLFRHKVVAKGYVRAKEQNTLVSENLSVLQGVRANIKQRLNSVLDDGPGRATILALVLGDKSGFNSLERELLQKAGLSHLFAISGLHVGLVFGLSLLCFKWIFNFISLFYSRLYELCPRPKLILLPSLLAAFGYSALAGFAVSTQRAIIMLCLFSFLRLIDKDVSLMRVLFLTACIVMLFDPFALLDAGFWLSFVAVFVIAICCHQGSSLSLLKLQPLLWIGMIPVSVVLFGQVSLISPLINLIAVPVFSVLLIPLTLLLTFGLTVFEFNFFHQALSGVSDLYDAIFKYLPSVADAQFAYVSLPNWGVLSSVFFTLFWCAFVGKKHGFALLLLSFLGVSVAIESARPALTDGELKVTLLDVGQGLSMVIQTSEGITVYDTGPRYGSGFSTANAVLIPYLKSIGAQKLSTVIVSHADNDHIGGYKDLTSEFTIAKVMSSRLDKIPEARFCLAGMEWVEGLTEFEVISPDLDTPSGSNNQSCVIKITHQGVSVLLTGDIEKQVEKYLVNASKDLTADIMLVPHQGSKTSSTQDFIDAVDPSLALVAAGYLNHYGHPHDSVKQRYVERGIQLLSTIDQGAMEISIGRHGYSVSSFRQKHQKFWHWRP